MKIVHLCMGFPIEFEGGITNYVRSLAEEQVNNNHEVIIYSNGNQQHTSLNTYTIKRYNSKIRPFSLNILEKDNSYQYFLRELIAENADVYHIHSLLGIDIRFSEEFSNSKLNYIISLHDYNLICPRVFMTDKHGNVCRYYNIEKCTGCIGLLEQNDLLNRAFKKFDLKLPTISSNNVYKRLKSNSKLLRNASLLLPVSKKVGEIFSPISIANQEIITIGNHTAYLPLVKKNIDNSTIINISFLGTFTRIKGADIFIKLCKNNTNKNVQFSLYGRGDKELINTFESVGGKYMGSYTSKTLPTILETVHLGAVLSIWEDNGPQVVMELINNGIPVIGTKRGGIPDFIIHGKNGYLFDPDIPIEIKGLTEWINNLNNIKTNKLADTLEQLKTPYTHNQEIEKQYIRTIVQR